MKIPNIIIAASVGFLTATGAIADTISTAPHPHPHGSELVIGLAGVTFATICLLVALRKGGKL